MGNQSNDNEKIAKLHDAAERGDPAGQYYLGRAYRDGKGVPQDDVEALKWFRKAAEQERCEGTQQSARYQLILIADNMAQTYRKMLNSDAIDQT